MIAKIQELLEEVEKLQASNLEEVEALRIKYLSKKGSLNALMADFRNVPAEMKKEVGMKLNDLKAKAQEHSSELACMMITYPSTHGVFESRIREIVDAVHDAGGQVYMDGANMNAQVGLTNPGYIGADVCHLNLHKTFAMPHGGGGPGAGPVGCKALLEEFLPKTALRDGAGEGHLQMRAFYGNFLVCMRALTYVLTLGAEGVREDSETAVLNANYMMHKLKDTYDMAYDHTCMHEFVMSLEELKKATGVTALDVAKSLIDRGIHPPTMYFPLIVHEALMLEPTETEARRTLDEAVQALLELHELAHTDAEYMHNAPHHAQIKRPDEVQAARKPVLKYVHR